MRRTPPVRHGSRRAGHGAPPTSPPSPRTPRGHHAPHRWRARCCGGVRGTRDGVRAAAVRCAVPRWSGSPARRTPPVRHGSPACHTSPVWQARCRANRPPAPPRWGARCRARRPPSPHPMRPPHTPSVGCALPRAGRWGARCPRWGCAVPAVAPLGSTAVEWVARAPHTTRAPRLTWRATVTGAPGTTRVPRSAPHRAPQEATAHPIGGVRGAAVGCALPRWVRGVRAGVRCRGGVRGGCAVARWGARWAATRRGCELVRRGLAVARAAAGRARRSRAVLERNPVSRAARPRSPRRGRGPRARCGPEACRDRPVGRDEELLEVPPDVAGVPVGVGDARRARRRAGAAPGPLTSIFSVIGNVTPYVVGAERLDLLGAAGLLAAELVARASRHGEAPVAVRSWSRSRPAYCGVRPHFDATLTIRTALPSSAGSDPPSSAAIGMSNGVTASTLRRVSITSPVRRGIAGCWERSRDMATSAVLPTLVMIGVPSSAGSYAAGQDRAPRALRDAGRSRRSSTRASTSTTQAT